MKTFESGITGMGLKICLDTKGIHLIRPGIFGSKDDFYRYGINNISATSSFIGITTINFDGEKLKGFDSFQADEIVEIYAYGVNGDMIQLLDHVGVDGKEFEDSDAYKQLIAKAKADYLQEKADEASKNATAALHAQAEAAHAAASAAQAYDRHQNAANKAVYNASVAAMSGAVPPMPSTTAYHISVNGQQYGPYDMASMQQMAQAGQINGQSMVWAQGMPAWAPAQSVPELAPIFGISAGTMPPPPTM